MGFHVRIDQESCVSTARCAFDAPGAFVLDDDGLAVARSQADELDEATQVRIARNCPNRAIVLTAADGTTVELD